MNPLTNVRNIQKLNETELELGSIGKKSWHDQYKDSAWIFVGGLPYDLTEGDVLSVFSQYGEIVNINLVRDQKTGKSKGFAFICFEDQRSTILSVDNLNSIKLLGRTIRVDHVENYKPPKEFGDEDEITKTIRLEGCAPKVVPVTNELVSVDEEITHVQKKKKKKEKRKKEKKRKHKYCSSGDSDESSDDHKRVQKVKQEKLCDSKYHDKKREVSEERNIEQSRRHTESSHNHHSEKKSERDKRVYHGSQNRASDRQISRPGERSRDRYKDSRDRESHSRERSERQYESKRDRYDRDRR